MGLGDKIRTLFRLFVLFTVLVAVALISAITTIRLTIRGHQTVVPNLVGVPLDAAQNFATQLGADLKVEDKVFNEHYPPNRIVSQVPPGGTRIKVGQHIHVLVSLGPPRLTVPNLVGASLRTAQITTIQRGLTVGDIAEVHWAGTSEEQVVAQDPLPKTPEVWGPSVNLLISLGEVPPAYACPNFIGRPLAESRRAMERAGFRVGQVVSVPTGSATSGTVVAQSPPPGSKIGQDALFDFQVAQ